MKLLKEKYTQSQMEGLKRTGYVVYESNSRQDLRCTYLRKGIHVEEYIIVDPASGIPWFVHLLYKFFRPSFETRKMLENIAKKMNEKLKKQALFVRSLDSSFQVEVINKDLDIPMNEMISTIEEMERAIYGITTHPSSQTTSRSSNI
jgi:hypothetical protein